MIYIFDNSSLSNILNHYYDIKEQCLKAGTAFYFKQWGGTNKKKSGRLLEGKRYDQMPLQL